MDQTLAQILGEFFRRELVLLEQEKRIRELEARIKELEAEKHSE